MAARVLFGYGMGGNRHQNYLTAAICVIHYDLWYNPAVESQATDCAFQIGQKRTGFVHCFVTRNSLEEKIDEMLASKQGFAV
jgi:SNF2 family DNA or RNA helicase